MAADGSGASSPMVNASSDEAMIQLIMIGDIDSLDERERTDSCLSVNLCRLKKRSKDVVLLYR